ncbi:hypothetical protein M404DRAFT_35559 [Pisolithus tinctorius Marx 270]|uniref:Uncharacterized protein n=1 Tax=Pisolithus tinctorius Marx 270 TaxID=870435 RepID=A0A0C3NDV1_PISTI|nr:hypothetical protein M404DRAFT_35559 [Pisolithus tinctorius Marx 270]
MSSSNKSPRVTSFGMDVDFGDMENQRQLSKSSENDPELSLNFIQTWGPAIQDEDDDLPDLESIWSEDEYDGSSEEITTDEEDPNVGMPVYVYRSKQLCRPQRGYYGIGHPLEDWAMDLLSGICYPGDDPESLRTYMDSRFLIYNLGDGRHMIAESKQDVLGPEDEITIETDLLNNPFLRLDKRAQNWRSKPMGHPIEDRITTDLEEYSLQILEEGNRDRFVCVRKDNSTIHVLDCHMEVCLALPLDKITTPEFNMSDPFEDDTSGIRSLFEDEEISESSERSDAERDILCGMAQPKSAKARTKDKAVLQQNSSIAKDFTCKIPKPLVVIIRVNRHPAQALIDTGSLADFMSVTLTEPRGGR